MSAHGQDDRKSPLYGGKSELDEVNLLSEEFDRIRSHRAARAQAKATAENAYHAGWNTILKAARRLHDQCADLPEVRYFVISRDESQVSIKLAGMQKALGRALTIYKSHPDGRFTGKLRYWVRDAGHPDEQYDDPEEVVRLMARAIAERVVQ